jgi:hypothetical protein
MAGKDDFESFMGGMMKQLLSKDVMYTPLKQVCDKFPEWLADNQAKVSQCFTQKLLACEYRLMDGLVLCSRYLGVCINMHACVLLCISICVYAHIFRFCHLFVCLFVCVFCICAPLYVLRVEVYSLTNSSVWICLS